MNHKIARNLRPVPVAFRGQQLELHPLKGLWWQEASCLVVSDVHVGKAGHFARHGMSVPHQAFQQNCWNLSVLYDRYQPQMVLYLGDLFHSTHNAEWDIFFDFTQNYPNVQAMLVKGNHEILPDERYEELGLEVVDRWNHGPFSFSHEPQKSETGFYNWCGHIHPAVRMRGRSSQSMKLSCFWLGPWQAVMPAFGSMTGTHKITPKKGDEVYVIAEEQVVRV